MKKLALTLVLTLLTLPFSIQSTAQVVSREHPYDVLPQTVPPYFHIRYEGSEQPEELVFPVTYIVWIPPNVSTLKGVIVHQHGCGQGAGYTGLTAAFDLHWQALAMQHDAALLSPSYEQPNDQDCTLWADPRNGSEAVFKKALTDLGSITGHSELASVPWALWGHSGGARWVGTMALLNPERMAALWMRSWGPLVAPNPQWPDENIVEVTDAFLSVPVMMNQGAKEGISDKDSRFAHVWVRQELIFQTVRAKGGLIGHSIDLLTEHPTGNQRYLAIPWFNAILNARLPAKNNEPLRSMSIDNAWLAPILGAEALPAKDYLGDKLSAVWLPNGEVAEAWMSYMHDNSIADDTPPPAPTNLVVNGTKLTWDAEADLESGLAYFIIERDGEFLAKVPESDEQTLGRPVFQSLYKGDTPRQPLPEMRFIDATAIDGADHQYRVIAVNTVGLKSH